MRRLFEIKRDFNKPKFYLLKEQNYKLLIPHSFALIDDIKELTSCILDRENLDCFIDLCVQYLWLLLFKMSESESCAS